MKELIEIILANPYILTEPDVMELIDKIEVNPEILESIKRKSISNTKNQQQ
jgi:hypothetical protein